jgi:CRP-like cAMP-binding protein
LLKETYGFEEDNQTLNIAVTREEIANIAGSTRETVARTLSELNEDKVVELNGKKIKILQFKKLVDIANISD